ncbi:PA14 domain-containing protein [Cesiribacter sp. SM1]|uniref:PKD domain-containing protein n=1 Tax=Cesiribacter sp. SM1 TaxID=2861196 RepID=UPI001CD34C09|nr:PA14 domain-containing protein [Cesiribacter sp. SM1]
MNTNFINKLLQTIIAFSLIALFSFLSFSANAQDCGCDHVIGPDKSYVRAADMPDVKPGDVICITAGVRGRLVLKDFKGTKEQPLIFKNCGGQVVFENNTDLAGTFTFANSQYFRVTGTGSPEHKYGFLIKKGGNSSAMFVTKSDFELDHIEIASAGFAGIMAKIDPNCNNTEYHQGNFVMENISIHDNFIHHTVGEGLYIGHTWYFGKPSDCGTLYPHAVENLRVYNNITEDTGADGIQVSAATKNVEVYNNTIRRYGADPFKPVQVNGLQIGGGSTGKYYNNLIIDGGGMGIQCLGMGDVYMYNNLIIRAGVDGIFVDERGTVLPGKAFHAHNNTVVAPKRDAIRMYSRNTTGSTFVNNLLVAPGSLNLNYYTRNQYIYIIDKTVNYSENNNLFVPTVEEAGFVNAGADDYQLQAKSSGVDKGAPLSYFGFDYNNNPRPQGASFDVGAHEFSANDQTTPNELPVVSAGADQTITLPADSLQLTASATDTDGKIVSVIWTKVNGPAADLSGVNTNTLKLAKLLEGTYTFRFAATDDAGAAQSDDVVVVVKPAPAAPVPPANLPPVVDAGADRTITLPTNSLSLLATATDSDGTIASVKWTQISGPTATMAGQATNSLSLSNLTEGDYSFRFTATDDKAAVTADNVIVTVKPDPTPAPPAPNELPVVSAGADKAITLPENSLTLTASAKDADGTITAVAWTKVSGPEASLSGQNTTSLALSNLQEGTYTFRFTATDDAKESASDEVLVTVNPAIVAKEPATSDNQGVNYRFYATSNKSSWSRLPNFNALTPTKTGVVSNFSLSPTTQPNYFGFVFEAYVQIDEPGTYTFYTNSDDGSQLFINDLLVVNNDGSHKVQERSGTATLTAGKHAIRVTYFEKNSDEMLEVSYAGPGFEKQRIPAEKLFTTNNQTGSEADRTDSPDAPAADSDTPTDLTATLNRNTGLVFLTWADNSSKESGYEIYMSNDNNGSYKQVGSTGSNKENYTVGGIEHNKLYYFKVRAKVNFKNTSFSEEIAVGTGDDTSVETGDPLRLNKQILVNFNNGMNASGPWNNFDTDPNPLYRLSALKDNAGKQTSVNITLLTPWGYARTGTNGYNDLGMVTGKNTGVYPDKVMQTCFWSERDEAEEMEIGGLEPNQYYSFTFFGSRNAGGNRTTLYTIGKNTVSLNASFNTRKTVTINNAKADATGKIKVLVQKGRNSKFAYLNAMTIEATGYVDSKKVAKGAAATNPVTQEQDSTYEGQTRDLIEYSVYPNAAKDHIILRYEYTREDVKLDIQILDFSGNVRLTASEFTNDENGSIRIELDQDRFPSGYYIIRVVSTYGVETIRFLKL